MAWPHSNGLRRLRLSSGQFIEKVSSVESFHHCCIKSSKLLTCFLRITLQLVFLQQNDDEENEITVMMTNDDDGDDDDNSDDDGDDDDNDMAMTAIMTTVTMI